MNDDVNPTFERVREIIAKFTGIDRARITIDSDLEKDLGVSGDDGVDLFAEFDGAFDVDWTDLHLGVHFGNEGLGPPLPWLLKDNCILYKDQPCKVSDIVGAIEKGRWPGTKLTLRSKSERVRIYLVSALQALLIGGALVGVAVAALIGLINRS